MYRRKTFLAVSLMIVSILFCSCSNGSKDSNQISKEYAINTNDLENSNHLDYKLQDLLIINANLEYEKDKSVYEGNAWITVSAQIDEYIAFVKSGAKVLEAF